MPSAPPPPPWAPNPPLRVPEATRLRGVESSLPANFFLDCGAARIMVILRLGKIVAPSGVERHYLWGSQGSCPLGGLSSHVAVGRRRIAG
jgi:hypothetical protein